MKEDLLLTGVCADGYFGISKKAMIHYRANLELLNEFRLDYFSNKEFNLDKPLNRIAQELYNVKVESPFIYKPMLDYFLTKDWDQCNKPKQKQLLRDCFPCRFSHIKLFNHTNLQCGDSQIRELFEPLLEDKEININNRSRVIDLYRDLHNKYHNKQLGVL